MDIIYENKIEDFYCRTSFGSNVTLACPPHLHYHIELGCVIEGQTKIIVDSNVYEIESGDLFICFPNQLHKYETIKPEKHILFIFNPDMTPEFSKLFISSFPRSAIIKGALDDEDIRFLMYKISELRHGKNAYNSVMIKGYLLALLGKIFNRIELIDNQSKDIKLLGAILKYCTKNYDQPLTLSVLERDLHISRFYISHTLSTKLHMGFNDYINSLRVSKACKYLTDTDMSITAVSETVGFNTIRTFNRAFIKNTGITPSEYRANKVPFNSASFPI